MDNIEQCKYYDKETGCIECKQVFVQDLYKQLQQLKEDYAELLQRHNDSFEQFKALKEENDELKETIQELNESIQTCNIERTKLYRKLEKIEEVVQNNIKSKTNDLKIEVHPEHKFLIDILQIIRGEE